MPRQKRSRRFEPRYGVNATMVAEEAKWLAREIDDYAVLSHSDVAEKCQKLHGDCHRLWRQFDQSISTLPERDRRILQTLIFRDFFHILELYLCHLREKQPDAMASAPPPAASNDPTFREWLFEP